MAVSEVFTLIVFACLCCLFHVAMHVRAASRERHHRSRFHAAAPLASHVDVPLLVCALTTTAARSPCLPQRRYAINLILYRD